MCVLLLFRDLHPDFPVIVASNREEDPMRSTMPPGLKVLGAQRALCPQDRRYGGTWVGVNDAGLVAAITNAPGRSDPEALSRGIVALEALSHRNPREAVQGVEEMLEEVPSRPFQLLVSDADDCRYARFAGEHFESDIETDRVIAMSNLLEPSRCEVRGVLPWYEEVAGTHTDIESLLDRLVVTLATGRGRDRETGAEFQVCVREGERRTVSGTLIALPRLESKDSLRELRFRYAAGNPLEAPFRDYDGLSRRLMS